MNTQNYTQKTVEAIQNAQNIARENDNFSFAAIASNCSNNGLRPATPHRSIGAATASSPKTEKSSDPSMNSNPAISSLPI